MNLSTNLRLVALALGALTVQGYGLHAQDVNQHARGALGESAAPSLEPASSAGWILNEADNICGLRDRKKLSTPATIDWPTLLDETPEMERIQRDGIDPETPEGIQLRQRAMERLTRHCKAEMDAQGHCSVWRAISHQDGRAISVITAAVRTRLEGED